MIFEAITFVAVLIFTFFVSLFPAVDSTTMGTIDNFYSNVRSTIGGVGWIFPTDTFFQVLGFVLIIELSVITFRIVRYVINMLFGTIIKA